VYRRWSSKEDLALAVLLDMVEQVVAVPDLSSTRDELVAFVDGAVKILGATLMGRVMQGLVSELAANSELARSFQERVVAMRVAEVRRLVERGIDRGEVRPTLTSSSPMSSSSALSITPAPQRRAARARTGRTRRRRRATGVCYARISRPAG